MKRDDGGESRESTDTAAGLLSPTAYDRLQKFVHREHADAALRIGGLLEMEPGGTVVEMGCGTGSLAGRFLEMGFDYYGVDPAEARIHSARARYGERFFVGTASDVAQLPLPSPRRYFVHGVFHHVDDRHVREIIELLLADGDGCLVVSEPIRPRTWWRNPLSEILMLLDEGRYPRRESEWADLMSDHVIDHWVVRSLWPRWPVPMLDVRIRAA